MLKKLKIIFLKFQLEIFPKFFDSTVRKKTEIIISTQNNWNDFVNLLAELQTFELFPKQWSLEKIIFGIFNLQFISLHSHFSVKLLSQEN